MPGISVIDADIGWVFSIKLSGPFQVEKNPAFVPGSYREEKAVKKLIQCSATIRTLMLGAANNKSAAFTRGRLAISERCAAGDAIGFAHRIGGIAKAANQAAEPFAEFEAGSQYTGFSIDHLPDFL